MADYPNAKMSEGKGNDGLKGVVTDSNIEGRPPEVGSVRKGTDTRKNAGQTGRGNQNHA